MPNGEEWEQACFLIKVAVEKTRLTSRTSEPMRKYGCDRKTVCTEQSRWRLSIQRTSSKYGENNSIKSGVKIVRQSGS